MREIAAEIKARLDKASSLDDVGLTPRRMTDARLALSLARASGVPTLLNPAPANAATTVELLALADVITPNETEFTGLLSRHAHEDVDAGDTGDADSGHTFLFTLNEDWVIDGGLEGNDARWINHSCAPNCEAILDENEDDPKQSRVFIESIRAIKPGEELTYDYGITLAERHTPRLKKIWACRCGSKDCTGTMLKPKR